MKTIERLEQSGFNVELNERFVSEKYAVKMDSAKVRLYRSMWLLNVLVDRYEKGKLKTTDRQMEFLVGLLSKVRRINDGRDEEITQMEASRLEEVFVVTSEGFVLTKEQEDELIERLLAQAKDDFKQGRFGTLSEALIHYNLHSLLSKVHLLEGDVTEGDVL